MILLLLLHHNSIMEALERARLALRKFLLENKEKVAADLENMRKYSQGNDIFQYLTNIESSISLSDMSSDRPHCVIQDIFTYALPQTEISYSPPVIIDNVRKKKDSEKKSESFFL